jgi:Uma2 family endonuclease
MENPSYQVGLTYEDFVDLPDDGLRHELIDGEHYVTAAPNPKHQRVVTNVVIRIGNYLEEHPLGRVYVGPFDVVFTPTNFVEPDLLYVSHERTRLYMTDRNLTGAPDLVVEVLSPSTRWVDEGPKLRLYERFGVLEYWLFNPVRDSVRVFRLRDGKLELSAELVRGEPASEHSEQVLSTPLLPGLELPLARIFD